MGKQNHSTHVHRNTVLLNIQIRQIFKTVEDIKNELECVTSISLANTVRPFYNVKNF